MRSARQKTRRPARTVLITVIALATAVLIYLLSLADFFTRYQPTSPAIAPRSLYSIKKSRSLPIDGPVGIVLSGGRVFFTNAFSEVGMASRTGKPLGQFKLSGGPSSPTLLDLAVDPSGLVYVSVAPSKRIFVYDWSGRPIGKFRALANKSNMPGDRLVKPVSLLFHSDDLYVSDVVNHNIKIYAPTGRLLQTIGGPGTGKGRFAFPNGMAVASDGTLYVCDSNNRRVQFFSRKGVFKGVLQPPAGRPFALPKDVAVDRLGRIHVVDTFRNEVMVFDKGDRFLFAYGKQGKDRLTLPSGIAIDDETGLIFITNRVNNKISVWGERHGAIFGLL